MPVIKEHNIDTGEVIEREMTDSELAIFEAQLAQAENERLAERKAAADKAALLEKLGITEDEAKLLLS